MFKAFTMEVSKTVKKGDKSERQKVGEITAHVPMMDEIVKYAAAAEQAAATDDKGKPIMGADGKPALAVDDDGLPIFVTDEANWLFGAVVAAVKMQARNKLVSGTATLKDGQTIPTNWAELVAEGARSNGAALAALRDCVADFTKYVGTLGKKESTAQTIITLFKNREALALQSDTMKGKIREYVEAFAATLTEEQIERYDRPISRVLETCQAPSADPADDM